MIFAQYTSSTFLILIQLHSYVSGTVQAVPHIKNVRPLIQSPLNHLLPILPEQVTSGKYVQDSLDLLKSLGVINSTAARGIYNDFNGGITEVTQKPELQQHQQSNNIEPTGKSTKFDDLTVKVTAVKAKKDEQEKDDGGSFDVHLKDGKVCEDHPDCALLPLWTCIADDVIWDDCPKMCGQCQKDESAMKKNSSVCEDHPDCALLPLWTCIADDVIWDDCPKMCGQCPKKSDSTNAKLPKPLTPGQLSKHLKPDTLSKPPLPNPILTRPSLPKLTLPNPSVPNSNPHMTLQGGQGSLLQRLALINLLAHAQKQQSLLSNLLMQKHIANPNTAPQLQPFYNKIGPQLLSLIKPVPNLPLQGVLPKQQCVCSQLTLPLRSPALLQSQLFPSKQSPLLQLKHQLLPQFPPKQSPLLQLQHQLLPQFPPKQSPFLQLQHQLLPQLILQQQRHGGFLPSENLQNTNNQHPSSACKQISDLLSKKPQENIIQDVTQQYPSLQVPNITPSNSHNSVPNLLNILNATPNLHNSALNLLNIRHANPNYHNSDHNSHNILNTNQNSLNSGLNQLNLLNTNTNLDNVGLNHLNHLNAISNLHTSGLNNLKLLNTNTNSHNSGLNHPYILKANPNLHNPLYNLLHIEKNPLQDTLKQLQTQLLGKRHKNSILPSGNNPLQLNALGKLQSQVSHTSPLQILQANLLQNLHNLKSFGSAMQKLHSSGNNRISTNNIFNSLLASNKIPFKRSTNTQKPLGELGLVSKVVQPVNVDKLTKSLSTTNIPEPSGKGELIRNLVQPINIARFSNGINTNNIPGSSAIFPGLQMPSQTDSSPLISSITMASKNSEDQDNSEMNIRLEDVQNIAEEYEHLHSKEKTLTETSKETQASLVNNESVKLFPTEEIQQVALFENNIHKRNSNSNISESESSTDTLSKESSSSEGLSSHSSKGSLLLASQLLKEARSDLSTIDNIISSYSINENEYSELDSKIAGDSSIISQDHIRSDISFEGIGESRSQKKIDDNTKDKLSLDNVSIQNSSEKKDNTDSPNQLESLLNSRLEAAQKIDSSSSAISLNDKDSDKALDVVSKLVSEAKSDISKIQDDLEETFSIKSGERKDKRESNPQKKDILKASNLLDSANLDLSSIRESLRTAKALNNIKVKKSDSEVIDEKDNDITSLVDNFLIGSETEYAKSPRVKRVLNDQEFFLDY